MRERDPQDLHQYCVKLRSYTTEELEDIYTRIHILRHPIKYKLLMMELESRRLIPQTSSQLPERIRPEEWLFLYPYLARHSSLRQVALAAIYLAVSTLTTFGMFKS